MIGTILNTQSEMKERMRKANLIAIKDHKFLASKQIKLNNRLKIYFTYIRPVFFYHC